MSTAESVKCPVCFVDIPLPISEPHVSEEGLSVSVDETYATEHIRMHEMCVCAWNAETGERLTDHFCTVHGILR